MPRRYEGSIHPQHRKIRLQFKGKFKIYSYFPIFYLKIKLGFERKTWRKLDFTRRIEKKRNAFK